MRFDPRHRSCEGERHWPRRRTYGVMRPEAGAASTTTTTATSSRCRAGAKRSGSPGGCLLDRGYPAVRRRARLLTLASLHNAHHDRRTALLDHCPGFSQFLRPNEIDRVAHPEALLSIDRSPASRYRVKALQFDGA